jgi:hypothetical protein
VDSPVDRPQGIPSPGRIWWQIAEKIEALAVHSRGGKGEKDG